MKTNPRPESLSNRWEIAVAKRIATLLAIRKGKRRRRKKREREREREAQREVHELCCTIRWCTNFAAILFSLF